MQFWAISIGIMALVGRMQIDSMLPTAPFGLLVDMDSSHLHLRPIHRKRSGKVPLALAKKREKNNFVYTPILTVVSKTALVCTAVLYTF